MAALSPNPARLGSGPLTVRFGSVTQQRADLVIFNVQGRRVRTLVSGTVEPGEHVISWDGRTDAGVRLASGIYFARLNLPGYSATKKVVLLP
jgi:flagellar hook assembly protein FlgD